MVGMKGIGIRLATGICLLILPISLAACSPRIQQRVFHFDESEYRPYDQEGTSTICGQAFLKTRGGIVKFAAGNQITIDPVTSYSSESLQLGTLSGMQLTPSDQRADTYTRFTRADGTGNFCFRKLPAGRYYVFTLIMWDTGITSTGGWVHLNVPVRKGKTVKVILTR